MLGDHCPYFSPDLFALLGNILTKDYAVPDASYMP